MIFKTPGMKIAVAGDLPRDTIAFYFQPAEEKLLGAKEMINNDLIETYNITRSFSFVKSFLKKIVSFLFLFLFSGFSL